MSRRQSWNEAQTPVFSCSVVSTTRALGPPHPRTTRPSVSRLSQSPTPPTPSPTDAISAANPRVIDDSRARKLSTDLKRCTYYETCATYGLNVERVFQDGNSAGARRSPGRGSGRLCGGGSRL